MHNQRKVTLGVGILLMLSFIFQINQYYPEKNGAFYLYLILFVAALIMNTVNIVALMKQKIERNDESEHKG